MTLSKLFAKAQAEADLDAIRAKTADEKQRLQKRRDALNSLERLATTRLKLSWEELTPLVDDVEDHPVLRIGAHVVLGTCSKNMELLAFFLCSQCGRRHDSRCIISLASIADLAVYQPQLCCCCKGGCDCH